MRAPETSVSRAERLALADALLAVGPDAPTLCEGWDALSLAAHLVVREGRPDSLPGLRVPGLRAWTDHLRRRAERRGLPALVAALRAGPPPWSPFALPGVDRSGNEAEMLVHHEDVRRAAGSGPRPPSAALAPVEAAAWRALASPLARARFLGLGVGVTLRRVAADADPADPAVPVLDVAELRRVGPGTGGTVTVTGGAVDLLLHSVGRRGAAQVAVTGPPAAVDRYLRADPRI